MKITTRYFLVFLGLIGVVVLSVIFYYTRELTLQKILDVRKEEVIQIEFKYGSSGQIYSTKNKEVIDQFFNFLTESKYSRTIQPKPYTGYLYTGSIKTYKKEFLIGFSMSKLQIDDVYYDIETNNEQYFKKLIGIVESFGTTDLESKLSAIPLPAMDPAILKRSKDEILAWLFEVSQWKVNVLSAPDGTFGETEKKAVESELAKVFSNPKIVSELIRTFYAYDKTSQLYSRKDMDYLRLHPGWSEYDLNLKKQNETHYTAAVKAKNKVGDAEQYLTNHTQLEILDNRVTFFDFTDIPSDLDPDAWTHQIVEDDEALPSSDMHIKTVWTGKVEGEQWMVYTGYHSQYPKQGMVIMKEKTADEDVRFIQVDAPRKEGALRAVTDDGVRLIVQSEEGHLYALDIRTHQFEKEVVIDPRIGATLPIGFMLDKDLNGDGKPEKLLLSGTGYADNPFKFTVNGLVQQSITANPSYELIGTFHVVDLNKSADRKKEIAFTGLGPSGMAITSFYNYNAHTGETSLIGAIPGREDQLQYSGNGKIITKSQRSTVLSTWFHEQTYIVTKEGSLEPVKQNLYKVGIQVDLKKPLSLYRSRTNKTIAGTIEAKEKAIIEQSDDKKWFFIRSDNGVKGWFEVSDFSFVVNANMDASELFNGLSNAG
jgi:hypothetical protein